ncbi:MAG: FAD-dependent oxidoreductase [Hyphomicrobiales bacterium]|nr:FAD-dependent oxidoreductase [Hyphomicrobiales bacterium]
MENIAVIGAGMAGLSAAVRLREAGVPVAVFEKSRGLGGRLATRRFDGGAADLGAAYVTARDETFQRVMQEAVFAGHATGWAPKGRNTDEPWMIGLPGMSGLLRGLARDLDITFQIQVERIGSTSEGYVLQTNKGGRGPFDAVITAIPAPQAEPLLHAHGKPFGDIADVRMRSTLAGVYTFAEPVDMEADIIRSDGPIDIAFRNNSKAGRPDTEAWVVHGTQDWSESVLEDDPQDSATALLAAFSGLAGSVPTPVWQSGHRWRYAFVEKSLGVACLSGGNHRIAACGDWCLGARVEAAYLSGRSAAEAVLV